MQAHFFAACRWVRDVTVHAVHAVTHTVATTVVHVRGFFAHPTVDQLIAANFSTHLGLFVMFGFYALSMLSLGAVWVAIGAGAFAAYYLWLSIKFNPYYTRLVVMAQAEAAMADGHPNGARVGVVPA